MKKIIIVTFIFVPMFTFGMAVDAGAAETTEPCTEENAEEIQREQSADSFWGKLWGDDGYIFI